MMDQNGLVSYWNSGRRAIWATPAMRRVGQKLHESDCPASLCRDTSRGISGVSAHGRGNAIGKTLELEARRKDGQEVSVAVVLSSIQIGGKWHAVGILRDETERKRAQQYREKLLARRQGINLLQHSLLEPAPLENKLQRWPTPSSASSTPTSAASG